MKRNLGLGLLALGLLLMSQQQAPAYSKFKFGVGLNISWEGANNSFLCGIFKGGPAPPGYVPESDGASPYSHGGLPPVGMSGYGNGANPLAGGILPGPGPSQGAQPVGYSDYSGMGGNGYLIPYANPGYYQAPSYWYGK